MIRTIWGDPERFKKTYYPEDFNGKYYLAGDGANRDLDGYFWIMGRIDDVLNVSGHRLGTMEIESALVATSAGGGSRGGRPSRRPHRRSGVRLRRAQAGASDGRRGEEDRQGAARLGGQGDRRRSPSRRTSASATTCRRRAPARSCAGCCARSPRARKSRRTSPRSRIRPSCEQLKNRLPRRVAHGKGARGALFRPVEYGDEARYSQNGISVPQLRRGEP